MLSHEGQKVEMQQSLKHLPSDSPDPGGQPETAPIDWTGVLDDLGGDEAHLRELSETLVAFYPGALQEMRHALGRTDLPAGSRGAHRLKGAVSNFGLGPAYDAARSLEEQARASQLDAARVAFDHLERELDRLSEMLQSHWGAGAR